MSRILHDVAAIAARLTAITERVTIDQSLLHADDPAAAQRDLVLARVRDAAMILDLGDGMRAHRGRLPGTVESLDINDVSDPAQNLWPPTYVGDACAPWPDFMAGRYDAVIALALLEHVYDPAAAIANMHRALHPGGQLFLYVPWIYRYHAPPDLMFQDYQRLSRDGLAYLLRDFEGVMLYPIRGKFSAIANLEKRWKTDVEAKHGAARNRELDAKATERENTLQASGYFVEAIRAGG
ncbi:MAG: methyltransferase domain-containing protein [Pseudomonadota bacterium]